ncbi:MAG: HAD-IC family P-type ATPase [Oscillospiraceae bacterium]
MKLWKKRSDVAEAGEPDLDQAGDTLPEPLNELQEKNSQAAFPRDSTRIYPLPKDGIALPGLLIIVRLLLTAVLLVLSAVLKLSFALTLVLQIAAALIIGYDIILNCVSDVREMVYTRENIPVLLAAVLAFSIGRGIEAVVALVLLQLACILRDYASSHMRGSLIQLAENSENDDLELLSADAKIAVGDLILIKIGCIVPADCIVSEGGGVFDCSFLSGNDKPQSLAPGEFIPAGAKCLSGKTTAKVSALPENSMNKRIAKTLGSGFSDFTETEKKLQSMLKFFVPLMLLVSLVLLIVLPLKLKFSFTEALYRVIAIIAISSPLSILLPIPLTMLCGLVSARKLGVFVKSATVLEKAADIKTLVFDKTGTLTDSNYVVTEIISDKMNSSMFLKIAAHTASQANNPIARAIVSAYNEPISPDIVQNFEDYPGRGAAVWTDGIPILLGSFDFLAERLVEIPEACIRENAVYMSVNGIYAGCLVFSSTISRTIPETLKRISKVGVSRISMVSGDGRERDSAVAKDLGISEYFAECSPAEKAKRIAEMKARVGKNDTLALVGNSFGIEEACEEADVSIILNGLQKQLKPENADIFIMDDSAAPVPGIISLARRTRRFIYCEIAVGVLIKLIIAVLAGTGIAPLWFAMLMDLCLSLAVVLGCFGVFRFIGRSEDDTTGA